MTRSWILGGLGEPAFERLAAELSGSELQSVLLELMQRRAGARSPADVLAQYRRDGLCRPSPIDLRASVALDGHLLEAAGGFEAIELSPVAPLAACSSVGPTSQHRVLSALRATEIVADPTNVLALECALRMRAAAAPVHLVTTQRVIRAQPVPSLPGYSRHFRIFVLASGGIEARDHAFTAGTLERHVRTMLGALDRLERHGYAFGARRVDLLATPERAGLADRIAEALAGATSGSRGAASQAAASQAANVERKRLEHPYYSGGLRYQIWVTAPEGGQIPLIDGGTFDWLSRLTSNRRAVYVATGTGAQLIALRFRAAAGP
ncbi:MAG TPA: hypothetical protein VFT22_20730 [Kofleriaceae bacterium]|nr:hypothetical protein [Kofleriaceae bacterium]